jgi:hypothetical protein
MPPKGKNTAEPEKIYDYSGLETGMRCQVESDGTYYAGEILQVSTSKNRSKAPVKISYKGYDGYDEWVGGKRLRCKALKFSTPEKKKPAPPERKAAQFTADGEIPVKRVARIYTMSVSGEADALKLDALFNTLHEMLYKERKGKADGYLKMTRMVCKAEWKYEAAAVFSSLDKFKAYDEGEWRKEELLPKLSGLYDLVVGGKEAVYSGVRVYDELGSVLMKAPKEKK